MRLIHSPPARLAGALAVLIAAAALIWTQSTVTITGAGNQSARAAPPPGGLIMSVAGTTDPQTLVKSLPFQVMSISAFDFDAQSFVTYIPGAPASMNRAMADHLQPDTIIWLRRAPWDRAPNIDYQPADMPAPNAAGALRAPRPGGLTVGLAGTSSLDTLVSAQPFTVASVVLFDAATQQYLSFVAGAPPHANTLVDADALEAESFVWMRRAATDRASATVISDTPKLAGTTPPTGATSRSGGTGESSPTASGGATTAATPSATATSTASPTASATPPATVTPVAPTTSTPTTASSGSRDPFLWPFDARSPWNHPIGFGAQYAPPDAPITRDVRADPGSSIMNVTHWSIPVYRAEGPERAVLLPNGSVVARLNVPDGARPTPPLVPGDCDTGGATTEGWADAHLNLVTSEARVLELYAAKRLCDGNLETRYGPWWHDLRGSGIGPRAGAHTGSRAYGGSSMGGLVRTWELEAGEIRHALAAALPASRFKSGYVWPATSQDSFHADRYRGNVPMGTLVALPPDFDLDSISYASPYGRVLAKAMQDYGIYLVDSAGNSGMRLYGEPSIQRLSGSQRINDDVKQLVPHLLPITNSSAGNVGGGGTPRAPLAPSLR